MNVLALLPLIPMLIVLFLLVGALFMDLGMLPSFFSLSAEKQRLAKLGIIKVRENLYISAKKYWTDIELVRQYAPGIFTSGAKVRWPISEQIALRAVGITPGQVGEINKQGQTLFILDRDRRLIRTHNCPRLLLHNKLVST